MIQQRLDIIFMKSKNFDILRKDWIPYFNCENDKIWRGKFDHFYNMSNFNSALSPGLIVKMTNSLVKEVRVGIAAFRSGINLQTRFKKKNDQINLILRHYLDLQEDYVINRLNKVNFTKKEKEWIDVVKTRIPRFYKLEAKTIHFNYFELEIIRRTMTENLEGFFSSKIKNLTFAANVKVYPYLNQVVSVRIIICKIYRISEEDILPEHIKEYKEDYELREKAIEEEEDSFDNELLEENNGKKVDENSKSNDVIDIKDENKITKDSNDISNKENTNDKLLSNK